MHNTVTEYTSSFVHENHTRMTNESVQSVTVLQGHSFCRGQTETLHLIITDACLLLLCVLNIRMQTRQCVCVCVCFGVCVYRKATSPMTNQGLEEPVLLIPNHALRSLICSFVEARGGWGHYVD